MKNKLLLISALFLVVSSNISSQDIESFKNAKPFEMSGSIGANLGLYHVVGLEERTSPFRYGITARLNFKIYNFSIPFYATIRDHSFNYGSSFTRIRINPQYKWIKLHIGDVYMNFNRYTLSGRTVRGLGVELTPGIFRFKAFYGKMEDLRSYTDTLLLGTTILPVYSRKIAAAGIGVGSSSTFFDLYAVRAWDNLDSLNGEKILEKITRQSNTLLGSTFKLRLGKHVNFHSNFGLSFFTDNLDSYGENTIIGENPLTSNLLEANISSYLTYAGDVGVGYSGKLFSLNGMVQYIQPYYHPLSVAYINSDLVNYTIGGSVNLLNRKVNLTGSIGIQSNNLSGSKLSTSNHIIGNIAANIQFNKNLSANINYFNFSQDFQAQIIQINDLYTYAISNNIATVSLRHTFKQAQYQYTSTLRGGRNNFYTVDDNEVERGSYLSYNYGADLSIHNSENNLRIAGGISYRTYERENTSTANYGLTISARKGWMDNKLTGNAISHFFLNDANGKREGITFRNTVGADYKLNKNSIAGIQLHHISRTSTVRNNFSEYRGDIRFIYSF